MCSQLKRLNHLIGRSSLSLDSGSDKASFLYLDSQNKLDPAIEYFSRTVNNKMCFPYHYHAAQQLEQKYPDSKPLFDVYGQPVLQKSAVLMATGASPTAVTLFDGLSCLNFLLLMLGGALKLGYLPTWEFVTPYLFISALACTLYMFKVYWSAEVFLEINGKMTAVPAAHIKLNAPDQSKVKCDPVKLPATNVFSIAPF